MHDRAHRLATSLAALSETVRRPRRVQALGGDRIPQSLVAELVAARTDAGLSWAGVAARTPKTASAVSRLESGRFTSPTLMTIEKDAQAAGARVEVRVRR